VDHELVLVALPDFGGDWETIQNACPSKPYSPPLTDDQHKIVFFAILVGVSSFRSLGYTKI
jgi:hypothetical protein